jgi:predicted porin
VGPTGGAWTRDGSYFTPAAIALLALAAPANAAKAVTYTGKTDSGHKVTFKVKNKRIHDLTAGIRMACVPIRAAASRWEARRSLASAGPRR